MNIGIDLDGVVFNMDFLFRRVHESYGIPYNYPTEWSMSCYREDVKEEIFRYFKNPYLMTSLPLLNDLNDTINYFNVLKSKGHKLFIVSSRYDEVHIESLTLVTELFGNYIEENHIVEGSKIPALKYFDIDIMIDDSPNVIQGCIDNDIVPIMISNKTTPYNYHMQVNKCENLLETLELITIIDKLMLNKK